LCEKKSEKGETGEREEEQRNYYTIDESHVIADPVITRHNEASSSTCGADKKERE